LGDWDLVVRARQAPDSEAWGEAHGHNHVVVTLGGCAVQERFEADGPSKPWAGISLSTYVPGRRKLRQTWVDDSGSYLAFEGGPEGDGVALYGEPREANGGVVQMRMVFRKITRDALTWSWERGTPGGEHWVPMMEIRYSRGVGRQ